MKVNFLAPQKLGNRLYKKGEQIVPHALAYNGAFKKLVKSGAIAILPRDVAAQKIQLSSDMRASAHARDSRLKKKADILKKRVSEETMAKLAEKEPVIVPAAIPADQDGADVETENTED